jgi:hypothetical protein
MSGYVPASCDLHAPAFHDSDMTECQFWNFPNFLKFPEIFGNVPKIPKLQKIESWPVFTSASLSCPPAGCRHVEDDDLRQERARKRPPAAEEELDWTPAAHVYYRRVMF